MQSIWKFYKEVLNEPGKKIENNESLLVFKINIYNSTFISFVKQVIHLFICAILSFSEHYGSRSAYGNELLNLQQCA